MSQADSTTRSRKRTNYIDAWMRYRGLKPGDVLRATGAGKDLVWKWRTKNNFPTEEYLSSLLDLLRTERECLFSPPPGGADEGKDGDFYSEAPSHLPPLETGTEKITDEDEIIALLERISIIPKGSGPKALRLLKTVFVAADEKPL